MIYRVIGITQDRRTADLKARGARLEQAFADARIEMLWRERVRANLAQRAEGRIARLPRSA